MYGREQKSFPEKVVNSLIDRLQLEHMSHDELNIIASEELISLQRLRKIKPFIENLLSGKPPHTLSAIVTANEVISFARFAIEVPLFPDDQDSYFVGDEIKWKSIAYYNDGQLQFGPEEFTFRHELLFGAHIEVVDVSLEYPFKQRSIPHLVITFSNTLEQSKKLDIGYYLRRDLLILGRDGSSLMQEEVMDSQYLMRGGSERSQLSIPFQKVERLEHNRKLRMVFKMTLNYDKEFHRMNCT